MRRRRDALLHGPNWFQLGRFVAVGASGFVLNLILFGVLIYATDMAYLLAATISNVVAIINNYALHRLWTFNSREARKRHQGARFLTVCSLGFAINLVVLRFGVETVGISRLIAEAIAAGVAAPVTFLLNRQWAFRRTDGLRDSEPHHAIRADAPGDPA